MDDTLHIETTITQAAVYSEVMSFANMAEAIATIAVAACDGSINDISTPPGVGLNYMIGQIAGDRDWQFRDVRVNMFSPGDFADAELDLYKELNIDPTIPAVIVLDIEGAQDAMVDRFRKLASENVKVIVKRYNPTIRVSLHTVDE